MKDQIIVTHNPRCRKSRETVQYLEEHNIPHEIRLYLKDELSVDEIADILGKLDIPAEKLIRKGEKVYKESYKGKDLSHADWIKAMATHPKLIERPIVIKGDKAAIGRPLQNVIDLLES